MKRLAVIALIVGFSLPAFAQRGGSHGGGFSGHAGSSFHGGFSGSAPSHFSGPSHFSAPRFTGGGSFRNAPGFPRSGFSNYSAARSPYNAGNRNSSGDRYRRPYRSGYGAGVPYLFPGGIVSWINPDFLGYPGYYDDFTSADTTDQSYAQPAEPDQSQDQAGLRSPYDPSYAPSYAPSQPSPAPIPEDAVTLVFKDGRPSEQIHNYALTRSTLYVLDLHHQDIPVDQLDLAATEKVNRDAGVDFQLPVGSR
jgi:hypothetical protein